MSQTRIYMFGEDVSSHKVVGQAVGCDGQYGTDMLIENENCLGRRLDLWGCGDMPLDRIKAIVLAMRARGFTVGVVEKVGIKPYREIKIESMDQAVRDQIEKHPGRAKGKAMVQAVRRLRELQKKRSEKKFVGVH